MGRLALRLALIGALFVVASVSVSVRAAPPGSSSTTASIYKYVGFSTATVPGDGGLAGMAQACQADYGPTARMAKSTEIAEATVFPLVNDYAWVQPVVVEVAYNSSSGAAFFVDATGYTGKVGMTCNGWSTMSDMGLGVTPKHGFQLLSCTVPRPVACAALQ